MGKIILSIFENCIFNININKNSEKIFTPNDKVVEFLKKKISEDYELIILSLSGDNDENTFNIDNKLKQNNIEYQKLIYLNNDSKTDLILEKIKPDIYIDYHAEFCAALSTFGINTYLFSQYTNIDNKCATGLKTL